MIEVFSTFYRLINHHRQVNKGDGIEQNNQPIGADCRMNGKENKKAMIHPDYPLRSEQEQIPSPNHLLPFQLKPYNNASHNQQYAYTRQRRQWETRFCFFRLYIHHFRLTEYQRTNTVSLHNDRAPCRFQHIKRSEHLLSSVNGNIRLAAKTKINS